MTSSARPPVQPARARFWAGFALATAGAILFSAKAIVAKLTYRYGVDALTVLGLRMLLALPFFAAVAVLQAWQVRRGKLAPMQRSDLWRILLLGFIGYYLSSYLDFIGLEYITAGLERLILFLSPTFVMLISSFYLKRHIAREQWLALGLAYFGVLLAFVHDLSFAGDGVLLGAGCVLGAALAQAIYLIGSGEVLKRVGATRLVAYAMCASAVYAVAHFLFREGWQGLAQPAEVYQLSLIHAVFHTLMPTFMVMWAVARVGAPMASQLGLIGPVSVLFLAWWLLDEPITLLQLAGTGFVLGGALVLSRTRRS